MDPFLRKLAFLSSYRFCLVRHLGQTSKKETFMVGEVLFPHHLASFGFGRVASLRPEQASLCSYYQAMLVTTAGIAEQRS